VTPAAEARMKRHLAYESRLALTSVLAGLPAVAVAVTVLLLGDFSSRARWTLILLMVAF